MMSPIADDGRDVIADSSSIGPYQNQAQSRPYRVARALDFDEFVLTAGVIHYNLWFERVLEFSYLNLEIDVHISGIDKLVACVNTLIALALSIIN